MLVRIRPAISLDETESRRPRFSTREMGSGTGVESCAGSPLSSEPASARSGSGARAPCPLFPCRRDRVPDPSAEGVASRRKRGPGGSGSSDRLICPSVRAFLPPPSLRASCLRVALAARFDPEDGGAASSPSSLLKLPEGEGEGDAEVSEEGRRKRGLGAFTRPRRAAGRCCPRSMRARRRRWPNRRRARPRPHPRIAALSRR